MHAIKLSTFLFLDVYTPVIDSVKIEKRVSRKSRITHFIVPFLIFIFLGTTLRPLMPSHPSGGIITVYNIKFIFLMNNVQKGGGN